MYDDELEVEQDVDLFEDAPPPRRRRPAEQPRGRGDHDPRARRAPARSQRQPMARPSIPTNVDLGADTIQKGIAELIGTFLLVLIGTMAAINLDVLGYVFGFGIALMVIVYTIGHVSGAHVNPAVTLGLALTGKFPMSQVPVYIAMQIIGAVLASGVVRMVLGGDSGLGITQVAENLDAWKGFIVELLATAILVFVIRGVATDKRAPAATGGLAIGGALLVIQLLAGPLTGASVNPARSLGPALIGTEFGDLWIYLIAPLIGGVIGAFLYDIINNEAADVAPDEKPYESFR